MFPTPWKPVSQVPCVKSECESAIRHNCGKLVMWLDRLRVTASSDTWCFLLCLPVNKPPWSNMGSFTLWISLSPLYFQQSRGSSMLCTLPVAEFGNFITHPFYQVEHGFRSCSMAILNVFVRSWGCMSLFSGHWFMTFTRWDIVTPKISHWRSSLLSSCTCVLLVLLFDMLERDFKDQMKQFPSE